MGHCGAGSAMEAATTTAPVAAARPATGGCRRARRCPPSSRPRSGRARRGGCSFACRERYGSIFTLNIAHEGTWVMLSDPEAVKQVFTGDPRVFHAGEGNQILEPVLGRNSVLVLDEKPHIEPAPAAAAAVPRRAHAGLPRRRWPRSPPARSRAGRPERPTPCGRGCRRSPSTSSSARSSASARGRGLAELRVALRSFLDLTTNPRVLLPVLLLGPERATRMGWFRRRIERGRPADLPRDRRAPPQRRPRGARRHPLAAGRRPPRGRQPDERRRRCATSC